MKKYFRRRWINFLVKHLYKWEGDKEMLVSKEGKMFLFGEELTNTQRGELKNQATLILGLELYKVLKQELEKTSKDNIFKTSTEIDDAYFGKVQLFLLDVMDRKLNTLSKM